MMNKVLPTRFMDSRREYEQECALTELEAKEKALLKTAEENQQKVNIGNPQKLIGAQ